MTRIYKQSDELDKKIDEFEELMLKLHKRNYSQAEETIHFDICLTVRNIKNNKDKDKLQKKDSKS
jgi:hypothetical protein